MTGSRVAVIGAGALGQLLGALLEHDGRVQVTVVSRRPEVVAAIRADGVLVHRLATGQDPLRVRPASVTADEAPSGVFEVVLLLNKSYDTGWALRLAQRLATDDAAIIALQNGLTSADAVLRGDQRGVAGVIYQGADYARPGVVRHTVLGPLVVAPPPNRTARVTDLLGPLHSDIFPLRITADRDGMLWEKAVRAVSNAVSGALFLPVRDITRSAAAWQVMEQARAEVFDLAAALGVRLDRDAMVARLAARPVARYNPGSTYQSLRSGRITEIDDFAGELEALGRACGVPTPVISTLRWLVRAREELQGG